MPFINTQEWAVSEITTIEATSATDRVSIPPGSNDKIMRKECLAEHDPSYYAAAKINGTTLTIRLGARPSVSYMPYIEIYVPNNFSGIVKTVTTSGKIEVIHSTISGRAASNSGAVEIL